MFGVNHFILSQTSPTIVPLLNARLHAGWVGTVAEAELKHRWMGGVGGWGEHSCVLVGAEAVTCGPGGGHGGW